MRPEKVTIKGRYPGIGAPRLDSSTMTCWIKYREGPEIDIRIDDDANGEFWLEIGFSSLSAMLKDFVSERVEQYLSELMSPEDDTVEVQKKLEDAMLMSFEQIGSYPWLNTVIHSLGEKS